MDNESGFILIEKELKRLNISAQVKEDYIELKGENIKQARIYLKTLFNSNIVELDDNQKSANALIERLKSLGLKLRWLKAALGGCYRMHSLPLAGLQRFLWGVLCATMKRLSANC